MQKIFLLFLVMFFYPLAGAFLSYADSPVSASIADDSTVNLNSQDLEKSFKEGEAALQKIKMEYVRQERKQHVQDVQQENQETATQNLQHRPSPQIDVPGDEPVRPKVPSIMPPEDPQTVIDLSKRAAEVEQQVAALGDDKNMAVVRNKLIKIKAVMERLKQERTAELKEAYIREKLYQINQRADNFNQEILKETQSGDYAQAKQKYDEFQQSMVNDFVKLKQSIARGDYLGRQ